MCVSMCVCDRVSERKRERERERNRKTMCVTRNANVNNKKIELKEFHFQAQSDICRLLRRSVPSVHMDALVSR